MQSTEKPQEIEVINAGNRIIRTNIVPHYLPIDESKIIQIEVPNMDGEGTHLETKYPEPEIDYWTYDEKVEIQPKILQLTFGEYSRINCLISIAEGFDLSKDTQRTYTMNPPACKYNLQENGDYEVRLVMELPSEFQIKYPELFIGLEMFDGYIPVDAPIQELVVDITDQQTLNWTLMQFSVAGNPENLTIKISPETQELLVSEMIEVIQDLGLNVELQ